MPTEPQSGEIQIILGPMFSGKTTELMRRLRRFQFASRHCLVVKYANDVRYDKNDLVTHDKLCLAAVPATRLFSLKHLAVQCSVIGIDEGQFFPDLVEFAEEMANGGRVVIVAALDGSFQRIGFANILKLIPLAENVKKLTAVCMKCHQNAAYTKRRGKETELEVIGGADKYMAVCRRCYFDDDDNQVNENDSHLANGVSTALV